MNITVGDVIRDLTDGLEYIVIDHTPFDICSWYTLEERNGRAITVLESDLSSLFSRGKVSCDKRSFNDLIDLYYGL